jgi:dephospho-CoA kinase
MLRVGLTGGIACGKSHVLRGLAAAGFGTLDLDSISHEVLASDQAVVAEVVDAIGPAILAPGGGVDRKALGSVVFGDASARAQLNAILHPRIRAVEEERTRQLSLVSGIVVTDGALLIESGGHLRFDRLIVVHCPEAVQIERLRRRDGLTEEAARQRLGAQMETEEKRRFASFEVDTSGTHTETDRQVAELAQDLRLVASASRPLVKPRRDQIVACVKALPEEGPTELRAREVLEAVARSGRLDLGEIAGLMVLRPRGAWYEAARDRAGETGTGGLAAAVALWCLGVRGYDPDFILAAAAAVARITRRDGGAIGGACLLAEGVLAVAMEGVVPADWRERWRRWRREAAKWGGGTPGEIGQALDAAAHHPKDGAAARREAEGSAPSAALAEALVGLSVGLAPGERTPEDLAEVCQALGFS